MKLTQDQINQLYTFTKKHYVDWYDVQTELVDHLANGIEAYLEDNLNVTFDAALSSEFKKFGIMGFNNVIEEKTKTLNKHYRNLVWRYFKDFFKLPKIILTLFLVWGYYFLLQQIDNRLIIIIPIVVNLIIVPIHFLITQTRRVNKIKKESDKKWLFDATSIQLGGFIYSINVCIQILLFPSIIWSSILNLVFSIVIILFSMALYISIFVVSPKLRKSMATQYPEYIFV